jgi:hypothetical protein
MGGVLRFDSADAGADGFVDGDGDDDMLLPALGALGGSADLRFMKRMLRVAPDSALVLIGSDLLPDRGWLLLPSSSDPLILASPRREGEGDGDGEEDAAAASGGLAEPGFHMLLALTSSQNSSPGRWAAVDQTRCNRQAPN